MFNEVGSAEGSRQELPSGSMLTWVKHSKNASLREVGQTEIPLALHVLGTNLVNLLEGIQVGNGDFGGR